MKRRKFINWVSSGIGLTLASRCSIPKTIASEDTGQSSPLFRFVALGDVGTGNIGQYAIAEIMNDYYRQRPFELVLLTGDNIYEDGDIKRVGATFSRPYRFLRKQEVPFYAVLGNHDVLTNNGIDQVNFSSFNMKGRYYSFSILLV